MVYSSERLLTEEALMHEREQWKLRDDSRKGAETIRLEEARALSLIWSTFRTRNVLLQKRWRLRFLSAKFGKDLAGVILKFLLAPSDVKMLRLNDKDDDKVGRLYPLYCSVRYGGFTREGTVKYDVTGCALRDFSNGIDWSDALKYGCCLLHLNGLTYLQSKGVTISYSKNVPFVYATEHNVRRLKRLQDKLPPLSPELRLRYDNHAPNAGIMVEDYRQPNFMQHSIDQMHRYVVDTVLQSKPPIIGH